MKWWKGGASDRPDPLGEQLRRQLTERDRRVFELEKTVEGQASALAIAAQATANLEKQLDRAKAMIRFHKQVSGVYRRRWEASARPGMGPLDPAAKVEREGEARIAAAIDARTVPGDTEGARHLRAYADRRVNEMRLDGKGEVDYNAVASEILDGEDDDA